MRPRYTVLAERGTGGWWGIRVAELPGVFSQARRLDLVESMARDAISLLLEVPADSFEVEIRERLDPDVQAVLDEALRARAAAAEHQRVAARKSREAARSLDRLGLPQRDIGRLLGISHQRVAQLLASGGDGSG